MTYEKKQLAVDKERGTVRVLDIMFAKSESDEAIEKAVSEVMQMENVAPALMSAEALYRYLRCNEAYVLERMRIMPIGSSFCYDGVKITRWSESTYNGHRITG